MDRALVWRSVPRSARATSVDPVLAARFCAPRLPGGFVRRPRLLRLASAGAAAPLLLINGPAGAGKSLLAADWVAAHTTGSSGPLVWLTAEPGDDEPGVFWACVLAALRRAGLDLPASVARPVRADSVGTYTLANLASLLADREEPVTLIIDQFERADGAEVADGLDFLLAHAGRGLHLVLIGRSEPLLRLHRYRVAGQIAEIHAADLAFLPEEAAALLHLQGLHVPQDAVHALCRRTEGWAAGLRMSALAAQQAADPEVYIKEFEAGEDALADFVLAEVLAVQSAEARDLLLRTSILERMHVDLADALTGRHDAAALLQQLAHGSALVEPLGHQWYRPHRLFAEILRYRLHSREPDLEALLHSRAARWLDGQGRLADALAHAAAADDWEFAANRLIEELAVGRLLVGLDAERMRRMFTGMPPETSGTDPELVRATLALARRDGRRALAHLDCAERLAPSPSESPPATALTRAVLHVLAAASTGSADAAQDGAAAADALESRTSDRQQAEHPEVLRLLHTALGSACLWQGRFDAARSALLHAIELSADAAQAAATHQEALSRLALIDQLRGTLGRAQTEAREALIVAERCGLPASSGTSVAHLVLARAAFERDELAEAQAGLDLAAEAAAADTDPIAKAGVAVLRSKLLVAAGDPAAALDALAPARPTPWQSPSAVHASPWAAPEAAEAAAAAHLAMGEVAEALDAAAEAPHDPACVVTLARAQLAADVGGDTVRRTLDSTGRIEAHPSPVAVRALLVRARLSLSAGDEAAAVQLLTEALNLARADRLRRPFRETVSWVRDELRSHPALCRGHTWLAQDVGVAAAPSPCSELPDEFIVEPLSGRECEVLELAAQMMSTAEIAEDLYLSVNTVKTHLKNINRKLCTTRRAEAVRRARTLQML